MRVRFQWGAYDQANYDLSFLCNDPYKSIIQLVGCHNRSGVTEQFILDNCKVKFTDPAFLLSSVAVLCEKGLLRVECTAIESPSGFLHKTTERYKVNWSVIKAINNAVKRMP